MGPRLPLNVLFVVPYAPTRIRTRSFHFIRSLAEAGHRLTVASVWSDQEDREALEALRARGVSIVAERLSARQSAWNCLKALRSPDPLQAHYSWSDVLATRIATALGKQSFDVVHVEHLRGARYGTGVLDGFERRGRPGPPVVWDSVDCITSLFRRAARESPTARVRLAARLELRRTPGFERRVASRFNRVLVTSEVDRRELVALGAEGVPPLDPERVTVVPNGVDLTYFSTADEPRRRTSLVMTGKMSYHANVTAATAFVRDVMPRVWRDVPETQLWIVGKDPAPEIVRLGERVSPDQVPGACASPSRVLVTGTVPDLRPFLRQATVAVAPIQYGVGIQNKVLEALACGTPVVATSEAVSALDVRSGEELCVANDPPALASAIVSLLKAPGECQRMGEAGRRFVERCHDWARLATRLATIYAHAR
ncbi:MAG: glycosyltransferase family 4 protein [Vicinamibacterales bacterium]